MHLMVVYAQEVTKMLIEERLDKIKEMVDENKSISINELSKVLNVSKDTVRRDLIRLEEQNVLRRTHGGAVSANRDAIIFDYQERSSKLTDIKSKLAYQASKIIKDNSSIFFDSSTTVEAVIPQLKNKNIYAITNSLTHAQKLAQNEKARISVLSGNLHKKQLFLHGSNTIQRISQFTCDYTLLGVFAISAEGIFIHTEEEGLVKRQMVKQAKTTIAIADHTKINTTGFFKVCRLKEIDVVITDTMPEEDFIIALERNHVKLYVTETN